MADTEQDFSCLELTAQIVSAHVSNNSVGADVLPDLIRNVYTALSTVGRPAQEPEKLQPAVPIKRSVFADYIVCLEDGKKLKMLKRHLQSAYGMTPDQYRERWGLPAEYPMVAPNYAERRSSLAREIGLGRKITAASAAAAAPDAGGAEGARGRPGRRRKA
ncbi:MucR family transcriptional regulator [Komagataeibacter nataicola]|uniref:MucR family transcriptional regulator n=1 Tax=Komagataeibacter nataicola TaxID=265960 RepID=A0A9N7H0B4_9PROT|nr:MucR family transcriptional regulator [Komagataeibacter nataicola]AQU86687.1 MucR family transcriptional regulator [Komagataeibacter nataicola]PYD65742.1 MucR family transcriptional regulator [Komagataeibacter nataicola]WEQ56369.1 MucR family transcriptional regulator [Komagataeibacter nataicola]WNM07931.1 MucR family transcriptional regulator [Komagataeibacter nataicola]GBR19207.1 Ros/MucR family transcriptional regulator [Komagataeibacter nataicola NRIC 0616]